jgi:hypothetical protein
LYKTETDVYDKLQDMQGKDIPRLVARVLVESLTTSGLANEYLDCPGILLEFIQGFPLTELSDYAARDAWQHVCEEAIRISNRISDRDIRNEDIKTRSFIVRQNPVSMKYKVTMIDFGSCVFREPDQDDQDWREWKAMQDEEGAIGLVIGKKLKGGFKYNRTPESEKLQVEFQSEK